jgi:hypothetical protein
MIKNYEKGYPISDKIMEAARCLQANPPPRAPDPASRGRGRPRGMQTGQEARGMGLGTTASPLHRRRLQRKPIFPWFWIGLAAIIIALVVLWNATRNRLNPDPDPVAA